MRRRRKFAFAGDLIGMTSMGPLFDALGLKCLFVENQKATERLMNRLPVRNQSYVRSTPSIVLTMRFFKKIGRKGAQARIDNSTAELRRQWARRAALARWKKPPNKPGELLRKEFEAD